METSSQDGVVPPSESNGKDEHQSEASSNDSFVKVEVSDVQTQQSDSVETDEAKSDGTMTPVEKKSGESQETLEVRESQPPTLEEDDVARNEENVDKERENDDSGSEQEVVDEVSKQANGDKDRAPSGDEDVVEDMESSGHGDEQTETEDDNTEPIKSEEQNVPGTDESEKKTVDDKKTGDDDQEPTNLASENGSDETSDKEEQVLAGPNDQDAEDEPTNLMSEEEVIKGSDESLDKELVESSNSIDQIGDKVSEPNDDHETESVESGCYHRIDDSQVKIHQEDLTESQNPVEDLSKPDYEPPHKLEGDEEIAKEQGSKPTDSGLLCMPPTITVEDADSDPLVLEGQDGIYPPELPPEESDDDEDWGDFTANKSSDDALDSTLVDVPLPYDKVHYDLPPPVVDSKGSESEDAEVSTDEKNGSSPTEDAEVNNFVLRYSATSDDGQPINEDDKDRWLNTFIRGAQFLIDLRAILSYKKFVSFGGFTEKKEAIIVLTAAYLPQPTQPNYNYIINHLFCYVTSAIDLLAPNEYVIVYFHCHRSSSDMPPLGFCTSCYGLLDFRLRKSAKAVYVVHPNGWVKTASAYLAAFKQFTRRKLIYVQNLANLKALIPTEFIYFPPEVLEADNSRSSPVV